MADVSESFHIYKEVKHFCLNFLGYHWKDSICRPSFRVRARRTDYWRLFRETIFILMTKFKIHVSFSLAITDRIQYTSSFHVIAWRTDCCRRFGDSLLYIYINSLIFPPHVPSLSLKEFEGTIATNRLVKLFYKYRLQSQRSQFYVKMDRVRIFQISDLQSGHTRCHGSGTKSRNSTATKT
jgi:hypothetical protein